ncbi:MAG: hypothetical protein E4H14_03305 [Candidatus Thorarchaeota archaeon]|nr:MAG: hypothetical protein E4H14_03305 [Candidatus Thorarchaeota archaeon]
MEVYEIAYLFLGLATLVAAGTIINYSRKRSAATTDPEIKKAFRPLYLFAIGLIIFAIGAILTYYEILVGVPFIQIPEVIVIGTNYYLLYYITLVELVFFAISAAIIMQQRIIGLFMIIMIFVAYLLMFNAIIILEASRVSSTAQSYIDFGYVLTMIIFGAVAFLFSWIAYDTRRSTSLALGYAMIVQVLAVPGLYSILAPELIIAISAFSLMGPAMIAFAFLRPDQKISGELVGYGASFAGPVLIIASLVATQTVDLLIITIVSFGALGVMLATGTTAYLYGRWRETKQMPTGLMLFGFVGFAVGQIIGLMGSIGVIPGALPGYVEIIAIGFSLSVFAVVAIFAAGYRSAGLIPLVVFIPAAIFIGQGYPQGLGIADAVLQYIWILIPLIIIFFLPVILFFRAWKSMQRTGTSGRSRPLGLAIGLLLYILIRIPLMLFEQEVGAIIGFDASYAFVSVSFIVFWLSITGRMERS